MEGPVKFQGCVRGRSRLEGCNYGSYPIHKFIHINDPGPMYPLWPFSIGPDEWRKECFRKRTFSDTFAVEYVQTGIFIFQQNNITMQVKPGEIFFVHLDQNNSMRCETDFATKRTIIMKGSLLRSVLETLGLNRISMIVPAEHAKIDRLFARLEELPLRSLFGWTMAWGLPLSALYAWSATQGHPWGLTVHSLLYAVSVVPFAAAYVAGICLFYRHHSEAKAFSWFAAPGRMALTCYITHSLFGIFLFYGLGLGLGTSFGLVYIEFTALLVFVLQIVCCLGWLRFFTFGPLEWLWRMLTYGRHFPIRRL